MLSKCNAYLTFKSTYVWRKSLDTSQRHKSTYKQFNHFYAFWLLRSLLFSYKILDFSKSFIYVQQKHNFEEICAATTFFSRNKKNCCCIQTTRRER